MGFSEDLVLAVRSAPEAYRDPTLAMAAASLGGDVQSNAESAAYAINQSSIDTAVEDVGRQHGGKGLFGATLSWLGGGIKGAQDLAGRGIVNALNLVNQPLQQVTHSYRYLRDVQSNHGFGAMLMEAIPMGAGAVAGGIVAGPAGIGLGLYAGSQAQEVVQRTTGAGHEESWRRTESADYVDPHGGQAISPGRDAARFLNELTKHIGVNIEQHKGFDLYDVVSGLGDGIFSVAADPLTGVGAIAKGARSAKGARGLLRHTWGGIGMKGTDLAQIVAQPIVGTEVKRGLERLARMSAEEIQARHKKLAPFANELGEADTWEKVGQVFYDNMNAAQMKQRALPRAGFLARSGFTDAVAAFHTRATNLAYFGTETVEEAVGEGAEAGTREVMRATDTFMQAGMIQRAAYTGIRKTGEVYKRVTSFYPVSFDEVTSAVSNKKLFLNDPGSVRTIYDMAKWGHTENMARKVAGMWATATGPERQIIFRNLMTDNLANRMEAVQPGWSTTPEGETALMHIADQVDTQFGGIDAGRVQAYGFDADGRIISKMTQKGQTVTEPIFELDNPFIEMPDYIAFDRNLKALGNGSELFGKVDDFLARHFTQNIFKRWALASGGFAIRTALSDLIPQLAMYPKGMTQAKILQIMKNRGWTMEAGEEDSILAVVARYVATKVDINERDFEDLVAGIKDGDGHIESAAVRSGHESGVEMIGMEEYVKDELYSIRTQIPRSVQVADQPQAWAPEHEQHGFFWQKQIKDVADKSPASRAAAAEYRTALSEGAGADEAVHRATLAAKRVLDETPEEILERNKRHFYGSIADEQTPGQMRTGMQREWIPGTEGRPGYYVYTEEMVGRESMQQSLFPGTEVEHVQWQPGEPMGGFAGTGRELPIGQQTVQPNIVNPRGNVPGGLRTGAQYGEINGPFGSTYKERRWQGPLREGEGEHVVTGTEVVGEATAQGSLLPPAPVRTRRYVPGEEGSPGRWEVLEEGEIIDVTFEQVPLFDVADPHYDWARVLVENLRGTATGQDGKIHDNILDAIASGKTLDLDTLDAIPVDSRPNKIMGVREKPQAPDRLSDKIFRKINTFNNWVSREPVFMNAYLDEMRTTYRQLVDDGVMNMDEAIRHAKARATQRVLPHIDNPTERSLMSQHARNFIPFYLSQQQAYARVFRLLADDPEAFRRVQMAYTNLSNYGGIYDDESGNQHFVIPGLGNITDLGIRALGALGVPVVNGIPSAFSGSLRSLASVSPFLEGGELLKPGPLVSLGARALNNILPETKGLTDPIVGEIAVSQAWWEYIVPNSAARNLMKATVVSDNRTQAGAVLSAVQALEYKQNVEMKKYIDKNPPPRQGTPEFDKWMADAPDYVPGPQATDMQKAAYIDRVKNHARILGVVKAALGAVSPVAPSVQVGDIDLKDELYALMKEVDPATGQPRGVGGALQKFLDDNPDATPYAVFKTDSLTASPLDSTHPAQQWVRSHMDFINSPQFGSAASYFVPQTNDPFAQEVYNEQMVMGFRRMKSPEQLQKDIHVSQGNRWYWDVYKPAKDAALATAKTSREKEAINEQFRTVGDPKNGVAPFDAIKLQNPVWYSNFSSGEREVQRQVTIQQMRTAIASGKAPDSPMTPKITAMLQQYDFHTQRLLPGRQDAWASRLRQQEKARWQQQLQAIIEANPDMSMVVNNVFRGA